jgi:hypothetical protein
LEKPLRFAARRGRAIAMIGRLFSVGLHVDAGAHDLTANVGGTVVVLVPGANRGSCAVTLVLPRS